MVQKSFNKTNTIILTVIIFTLLMFAIKSEVLVSATRTINDETVTEELKIPSSIDKEALFTSEKFKNLLTLQSTIPATNNEENNLILRMVVENTNKEPIQLIELNILKNEDLILQKSFGMVILQPKQQFIYKSPELDLNTDADGRINTIKAVFKLINQQGVEKKLIYTYEYLVVTKCKSSSDCGLIVNNCDLENLARLSTTKDRYCVKSCFKNLDCFEGQLCFKGRCGY